MKKLNYLIFLFSISLSAQLQWHPLTNILSNANNQRFDDVFFINDNIGWAANGAYAAVYKTTDGGNSWTQQLAEQTAALPGNYYFRNIEFLNEDIGFLGTLNGVTLRTIDGGNSWTPITNIVPNPAAICGLDTVGSSTVYGCGSYFSSNAYIIKSTDSGATWQYINMGAYASALVEILFEDENIGYASGQNSNGGVILKTIDGGSSWTQIYNTGIPGEYVWKLQILNSNHSIVFGSVESVAPLMGKLLKSTDGGDSWVSKNLPYTDIQGMGFMTEMHGFMGGYTDAGDVVPFLETNDSGDTWTDAGVGSNLNRVFIMNDNLAYASGTTIYKYNDANLAAGSFTELNRRALKAFIEPNPVKDKLNLTIVFPDADHIIIELYDSMGHRLKELRKDDVGGAMTKRYSFDFPYAAGVYVINLHNDTGRQTVKFVKQ
jgi:photosystem II stability/assembly factor-like uncharacterized protein